MKAEDLKNSILQLAMEGKLVPQNHNDEPAYVLLEKIQEEKEKLIKEKKIKRNNKESFIFRKNRHFYEKIGKKGEPICIDDEIPFNVPESWGCIRMGTFNEIARGGSPRPIKQYITEDSNGINWIKIGDTIKGDKYIYSTKEKIKPEGIKKSRYVEDGDFLLTNSMSFGRPYILKTNGCIHDGWLVIKLNEDLFYQDFMFYLLSSNLIFEQFSKLSAGSAVKNLKIDSVKKVLIPIPPLNEQKIIVDRIEKILPLIEEYGKYKEQLDKINLELPIKLRSSILQEAIQGKLVSQGPNDEPASVLLEKIMEEKERLIKEKKIKRNKNESYIFKENNHFYEKIGKNEPTCIDDEIPFKIPDNWVWVKLNTISQINPKNKIDDELDVSFIPMSLINESYSNSYSYEIKKWKDIKKGYTHFAKNDIAIAKITPCFENLKSAIFYNLKNNYGAGTTELHIIRPYLDFISLEYLLFLFKSNYFIKNGEKNFTGTAGQKRIGKKFIENFLIPLPPFSEQRKIVNKINCLFEKIS